MAESLHSWLQAQEAAGTLESQGKFTLEQSKAWEKLGAYQLPFQDAWVLKLVQAAMASPRARLAVTLTRVESQFTFWSPPDWSPVELKNAIFDIHRTVADALYHLSVGIRSLALMKEHPFSIRFPNGECEAWTGEAFAQLPHAENPGSPFSLTVTNYRFGESGSFFSFSRARGSEFRARITRTLSSSCHLGTDRLTLDSRKLESFSADPHFGNNENSATLAVLRSPDQGAWEPMEVETGCLPTVKLGRLSVLPSANLGTASTSFSTAVIVALGYRKFTDRRDMRLDRTSWEPTSHVSEILWHCDGVVIEREQLPWNTSVGLGLIVSAKGLRTDLTGLRPLDNEEKQERLRLSLSLLETLLSKLCERSGGIKVKAFSPGVGIVGATGVALLFSMPLLGAVVMAKAGYDVVALDKQRSNLENTYRDGLKGALEQVQGLLESL